MRNARPRGAGAHITKCSERIILFMAYIIFILTFIVEENKLVKRRRCQQKLYFGFDVKIFAAKNFE